MTPSLTIKLLAAVIAAMCLWSIHKFAHAGGKMERRVVYVVSDEPARQHVLQALRMILIDPKYPVQVTLEPYRKTRSVGANKHYWGVLQLISDYTGDSTKALHHWYACEFIGFDIVTLNGRRIEIPHETHTLDEQPFREYVGKVVAHANTFHGMGIPIDEEGGRF